MAYSSFVREHTGTSGYAQLEVKIGLRQQEKKEIYVVNISSPVPGMKGIGMGDSIDIIVQGGIEEAERIVQNFNEPVGIVRYEDQSVTLLHSQAVAAREIARKRKQPYYVYEMGN